MLEVCFKPLFGCSLLQLLRLACVLYITLVMFKTILMSKKLRLGGGKKSHPKDKGFSLSGFCLRLPVSGSLYRARPCGVLV